MKVFNSIRSKLVKRQKNSEYKLLMNQKMATMKEILGLRELFRAHKSKGSNNRLNKTQFIRLYAELRAESYENISEISAHIFECFDLDNDGFVSFDEFVIGYILTSRGLVSYFVCVLRLFLTASLSPSLSLHLLFYFIIYFIIGFKGFGKQIGNIVQNG